MALQPGTGGEADGPAWNPLAAFGRMVGFSLLSGLGLTIIAGVVLVPAYARLAAIRYQRGCAEAQNRDAESLIAAYDRMLAEAPRDEVFLRRLARSQLGLWPRNELVVPVDGAPAAPPPGMILPIRHPRPEPPPEWLARIDAKLRDTGTRRGLFVVAVAVMAGAVLLFAPPTMYRRKSAREAPAG